MSEILCENNILQPKKVSLSHQCSHFPQDQVNVVLWFNYPVKVYVHADIEWVVDVGPHESKD